ncbi:MAG: hypothetical protein L0H63_01225 [Nitrococcus sp.]|nr:hypothetical protein [Nitrococcus sp.]
MGPRFNGDSCKMCHSQPAIGGTNPLTNPEIAIATAFGARNQIPSFLTPDGPAREARFIRNPDGSIDGGVHQLFVISGRVDNTGSASDCTIEQEDFESQVARDNVVFRIPTPVFGTGLMESIADTTILANMNRFSSEKRALGISGHPNHVAKTISRFGWKAQNLSMLFFSGEASNVELGITNQLLPVEREQDPDCQYAPVPNDSQMSNDVIAFPDLMTKIQNLANFMRFLAPPEPSPDTPGGAESIERGREHFIRTGCAMCHTPALTTNPSSTVEALQNKEANLFSDLLVHNMGPGLADNIAQGEAAGDEFRTAPLWGLGKRIFFLHDGRTTDLLVAIRAHRSRGNGRSQGNGRYGPSEANKVIAQFERLDAGEQQDMLNFLRSL